MLLTTYVGLILVGLLVLFTLANRRARAALNSYDPVIAAVVAGVVMGPHLDLARGLGGGAAARCCSRLRTPEAVVGNLVAWLRQIALIFAAHAGLIVLVALVAGWPWPRHDPAPVIVRRPVDPFARQFVYFFAVAPAFAGTLVAVLIGWSAPVGGIAPLVILSGLLVVVAAGDGIEFSRQHVVIAAWFGLLIVPPIMAVAALVVLPWLNIDLKVTYPAQAMARFFSESFERRTGAPLQIVTGDPRTAALIALGAPSRPSVFLERHARAFALGDARCDQEPRVRSSFGRPPIPPERRRPRSRSGFRISCPRSRAHSSARCRVGCRSCASAGR